MRKYIYTSIIVAIILSSGSLHAFTNTDLMGNYTLQSFTIQYPGYAALTQDNFSSFTGRASVSNKGFLMEMSGYTSGTYVWQWACGFYTISGNRIIVTLVGETTCYVDIVYSTQAMTTSGYDPNEGFNYTYVWQKNETLYTKSQLDQAVASATTSKDAVIAQRDQTIAALNSQIASMYTQEELTQAVASAEAAKDVVISQRDQAIEALNVQVASMYTQEEWDQAVASVETAKDLIIAQRNQTIEALNAQIASMYTEEALNHAVASAIADLSLHNDGRLDLSDVIFGLQALTRIR